MKIKIASGGHRFTIPVPLGLLANPLAASIGVSILNRYIRAKSGKAGRLSGQDFRHFFTVLAACRAYGEDQVLLSVRSADGGTVEIVL